MRTSGHLRTPRSVQYALDALDALHALPCGCVAAVFRTNPVEMAVVSLEARGPHCLHAQHQTGRVLALGPSGVSDETP